MMTDTVTRILLVEDNPSDARLIVTHLKHIARFPHTCQVFNHIKDARPFMLAGECDVVLLDLSLPDSDTATTLTKLPELALLCPIVVLTGLDDETIGIQAMAAGAQDYLVKQNINGEVIVRAIKYAIARFHADIAQHERAVLEKALEKERQLHQLKSEFVSIVSHEFRSPLSIILTSVGVLERYYDRLNEERRQQKFKSVFDAVHRLTDLMNNVLVLGQSDDGQLTVNKIAIDAGELCQEVIAQYYDLPDVTQTIIYKETGNASKVALDRSLMRNVLANLLSNASKYSPAESEIRIGVHYGATGCQITVADQGIGIPVADKARLFTPFYRASNAQEIRGTGIGLVIVQRVVNAHGGKVEVESAESQGTRFILTFPYGVKDTPGMLGESLYG